MRLRPDRLGPFLLKQPIGQGGMAVVYDAVDERTTAACAIKLHNRVIIDEESTRRFEREASAGMIIDNPHVIRIHGLGSEQGVPYIVMERVTGVSLDRWMERHEHPDIPDVLHLLRQALLGLQAMEDAGIIHRDLKPENLMVGEDGHLTIIDLGLARSETDEGITAEGVTPGTIGFLAPELLDIVRIPDHRCDQFSLGVIAYLMLTRRLPFPTQGVEDYLNEVRMGAPPMTLVNREVPKGIAGVIHRMLHANPVRRYPSAYACLRDLEQAALSIGQDRPASNTSPVSIPPTHSTDDPRRDYSRVSRAVADMRQALSHHDTELAQVILQRSRVLRTVISERQAQQLLDHYLWLWRSEIRWMRLSSWLPLLRPLRRQAAS